MGCWNETCAVSHLPIKCDERVVAYIVGETGSFYEGQYYRGVNEPASLAIRGKYNDYGSLEEIDSNLQSEIILEVFKFLKSNGTIVGESGALYTMEGLLRHIERGELRHKKETKENRLCLFMVHERIHDALIAEISNRKPYKKDQTYRELLLNKYLNQKSKISPFFERLKEMGEEADGIRDKLKGIQDILNDMSLDLYTHLNCHPIYKEIVSQCLRNGDGGKELLVDQVMFQSALTHLRMNWDSTVGSGSQSDEMVLHRIVANQVMDHFDRRYDLCVKECEKYGEENPPEKEKAFEETIYWSEN